MAETPLLDVTGLVTGYHNKEVLHGVDLTVKGREVIALIGHNGAGKSTLLKAVFGLLRVWSGSVRIDGVSVTSEQPRAMLDRGLVYVPQGNRVFRDLTVRENLKMAGVTLRTPHAEASAVERVLELFPVLEERLHQRAASLSGGEKQMLALANGLMLSPRLLLLDEPSLGLAPSLVSSTLQRLRTLVDDIGVALLVVEQKVREVLAVSDRVLVLRNGSVSFSGSASTLRDEERLRSVYL